MGINLQSVCHLCKEKVFHYRRQENKTMIPFYKAHHDCMRINPNHVETKDDQMQYESWMDDDAYRDIEA